MKKSLVISILTAIIIMACATAVNAATTKTLADELYAKGDITIIMATHDLDEIHNPNIRVIELDQEIIFDGSIKEKK